MKNGHLAKNHPYTQILSIILIMTLLRYHYKLKNLTIHFPLAKKQIECKNQHADYANTIEGGLKSS